jgi:hypothetical protein
VRCAVTTQINLHYDSGLRGFIVSMPPHVTLTALHDLTDRLFVAVAATTETTCRLLLDTNQHDFESIACLKALREMLEAPQAATKCVRVAFVQPPQFREPLIASDHEGYFNDVEEARAWLAACVAT